MATPPWLVPPDYLGAMKAGAGIGLERSRIDTGSAEAADRLRLAYTQLAAQEDRAAEMDAMKQAHASEALRHQSDLLSLQREKSSQLDDYRNNRLEQFGTEEQRKQSALEQLTDYRNNRLSQIDTGLASKSAAKIHFGPNGQVLKEEGGKIEEIRPRDPSAPKYTGPHTEVEADEFGPKLTGPLDNPVIKRRLEQKTQKEATDKLAMATEANKPGIISRVWHSLTGSGSSGTHPQSAGESLTNPQPKSSKRVKVTGPDGQKGTILEGDSLTDGWTLAE